MNFRPYFKHVERLRQALSTVVPRDRGELEERLRRHFTEDDFDYLNDLVYFGWTEYWYVVDADVDSGLGAVIAESPKEAMSVLLTRHGDLAPFEEVIWDAPSLSRHPQVPSPRLALRSCDTTWEARGLQVQPVVRDESRQHIERELARLRSRGEESEWQRQLEVLGVHLTQPIIEPHAQVSGAAKLVVRTPASLAEQLRRCLADDTFDVSVECAQELLVVLSGAKDWRYLMERQEMHLNYFPAMFRVEIPGERTEIALLPRYADALAAFSDKARELDQRQFEVAGITLSLERPDSNGRVQCHPVLQYEGRHPSVPKMWMQAIQCPRIRERRYVEFVNNAAASANPAAYVAEKFQPVSNRRR